jgi:pimeloyl-ACP methyl ester carboxylesterase
MAVTPHRFDFDGLGVRLAGERWDGAQTGDIVLLLHGGDQTRHSWKSTARRLAESGRTAVLLDARGHGDSEWHPGQDYTLDGCHMVTGDDNDVFADRLEAFLDQLDADSYS